MDKLLGEFTNKYINELDIKDLKDLEKFLNIDDDNLYNYYKGLKTDIKFEENKIFTLFKNFKFNKKK